MYLLGYMYPRLGTSVLNNDIAKIIDLENILKTLRVNKA